jgi:hypothetical protein
MIIWTGWGILIPFLLGAGLFGASFAANSFYGPGSMETHSWVFGICVGLGGLIADEVDKTIKLQWACSGDGPLFKGGHKFLTKSIEDWPTLREDRN